MLISIQLRWVNGGTYVKNIIHCIAMQERALLAKRNVNNKKK